MQKSKWFLPIDLYVKLMLYKKILYFHAFYNFSNFYPIKHDNSTYYLH